MKILDCFPKVPVPKSWPKHVRLGFVHAVALSHRALTVAHGWCADSPIVRVRLMAELDTAKTKIAMLEDAMRIKDARMARIEPRHRPHYTPVERPRIVALRAAMGWSRAHTGRVFQITGDTVSKWQHEMERGGESRLFRFHEAVNRFPEFVTVVVQQLKAVAPTMGRRRIADVLARAGVHLSTTTVRRKLGERVSLTPRPQPPASRGLAGAEGNGTSATQPSASPRRTVIAKYPGHIWNIDLTQVPTVGGYFVPWFPKSIVPVWPFCWHVLVVLDHFSRQVLETRTFRKEPTSVEVSAVLEAVATRERAPKYTVTDQASQFTGAAFAAWCARWSVKARYGAVGRKGSIATIERFHRSLESEGLRKLLVVPLGLEAFEQELHVFTGWYSEHRPHMGLGGATPSEIYHGRCPARDGPRFEPRARYPVKGERLRAKRGTPLVLDVTFHEGHKHLPIVTLKRAA